MENDSLEELKWLIEEDIYLIRTDREVILAQLTATTVNSTSSSPKEPARAPVPEKSEAIQVLDPILIPQQESQIVVEEVIAEPIPVRGDFSKGVLILHEEEVLNSEVMEMLMKMIKACGHSISEVGMVSSAALENRSMEEFQNLNAHTILKFGRIKHPINAVSAPRYEVYSENETEYLFADSLSEISEDKTLKVKLWTSLQVLFNLSPKK